MPQVVIWPSTSSESLTAIGTPASGISSPSPFASLASTRFASSARLVGQDDAVGVQLGVEPVDAVEVELDEVGRGDVPRADHLSLAGDPRETPRRSSAGT